MTMHWVVLSILTIVTSILVDNQHQAQRLSEHATLDSLGRNFLIYRVASAEFSKSNPGFNGIPNDAALNLPTWFVKPLGATSHLDAGTAYTYFNGTPPLGLSSKLFDLTQSLTVGVNRAGFLYSPSSGTTAINIPAAVPEGAVVAVN